MMVIDNVYEWGDVVFLKSDSDQYERTVTGIIAYPDHCEYILRCGSEDATHHHGIEILSSKDYKKSGR
jgi:hypothetical protein